MRMVCDTEGKMKALLTTAQQQIINKLYQIGAIKLGEFQLKSGLTSSIYIDLRLIISYPELLRTLSQLLWEKVSDTKVDLVCGVPYAAMPVASCISLTHDLPMIMRRKEKKLHGTKQQIEGVYRAGQSCLLVEDVLTTGASILETADDLEAAGLTIKDVAVLLDREQGGNETLQQRHYTVHAVLTMSNIVDGLLNSEILSHNERELITQL
jgi:orotate phosphoribosyltransferase